MRLLTSRSLLGALSALGLLTAVHAAPTGVPLPMADNSAISADPLLSVDLNRGEIVSRIMNQWQGNIAAPQRESLKQRLSGLRADRLLAISLVGTFDGVLEVLYGQEKADLSARTSVRNAQKVLGDPNTDLVYTPVTPCRLFDTRAGQISALGTIGGIFTPSPTEVRRTITPAGACGIPVSGVKALAMGFTTQNTTLGNGGILAVVAPGAEVKASVAVFSVGAEWNSSNIIAPTATAGQFDAVVRQSTSHLVMDVVGYFKAPEIAPPSGQVLISVGSSEWRPFSSADNLIFDYFSSVTNIKKPTTGTNFIQLQPSLPTVMFGRSLQLDAVELCYATISGSNTINYVEINTITHSTGPGSRNLRFNDSTVRADSACRYYSLPTPFVLTGEDGANIFVNGNWAVANTAIGIGRTTFVLSATTNGPTPPSSPAIDTPLTAGDGSSPLDGATSESKRTTAP